MKIKRLRDHLRGRDGDPIAVFGAARLVKHLDGKIQLVGGTPDDRRAAREWCSLFLNEAAVAYAQPVPSERTCSGYQSWPGISDAMPSNSRQATQ